MIHSLKGCLHLLIRHDGRPIEKMIKIEIYANKDVYLESDELKYPGVESEEEAVYEFNRHDLGFCMVVIKVKMVNVDTLLPPILMSLYDKKIIKIELEKRSVKTDISRFTNMNITESTPDDQDVSYID